MKKSIPKICEWELEALIPRNNREREWKENIQRLKIISQSTSHQTSQVHLACQTRGAGVQWS